MAGTPSLNTISPKLERIAELAKQMRDRALTSLSHHIDIDWLHEAYRRTRKDGAAGVDGQTSQDYEQRLEENLQSLLGRAKSGDRYRAPSVRRVYIPKGSGRERRAIGIPTFEDKVLQRAVVMALGAVYEQDFLDCSYGFRPKRGAHQALEAIWQQAMKMGGGWVLEADIESFFDSVPHDRLQQMVRQRVRDGVILRLIGKWLNAGVMEQGCVYHPDTGTPQGGVISPLLSNVYLHEVLDLWFEQQVKPRLRGRAVLVRYCDDFVVLFEQQQDAQRVLDVLPKRFGSYGLRLHPDKTRLVKFGRPQGPRHQDRTTERSATFEFLGFVHYWGRSHKGNWVIRRKTASLRMSRALHRISVWCRVNRHLPIGQQHQALSRKLRGHDAYYGITGNIRALQCIRAVVMRCWRKWLSRRSQKGYLTWEQMQCLEQRFALPQARIVHSVFA